ncbi:MAG: hypothetical protein ACXW3E_00205 [Thermoanaerobaculia bacterium]
MEDVRPYRDRNEEKDRPKIDNDNPVEWELARVDMDEELSFDIPRD